LILNNNFLGMVRQWQQLFFDKRYSFTQIKNPEFTKIAEAYSIENQKITKNEDLSDALDKMLKHKGAYLLEVVVVQEENVFPMIPVGASVSEVRLS
jgi:acetolactate synthase I/II/III large subunit